MSNMTFELVFAQAQQLSPQDRLRLVEQLVSTLRAELPEAPTDWHQFLRETYGALRETPIERYPQGEYETREPLEGSTC